MDNEPASILPEIYSMLVSSQTPDIIELLINKIKQLEISERSLCDILRMDRATLRRLLDRETKKIDIVSFIKISQFLGFDLNELAKIYLNKLNSDIIGDIEYTKKSTFILNNFDIKKLLKSKFFKSNDLFEIEDRIKKFFELNSIFEFNSLLKSTCFSKINRKSSNLTLQFWVATAASQLKYINNPNPFDRDRLSKIASRLRGLTISEERGFFTAVKALYEIGVTVIFQSYLSGTAVRGATFVINNKPCIVLTDINKRYDSIWFALAHEIYHVLKDFDRIKDSGYHLTGEEDIFYEQITEDLADSFARELLLPKKYLNILRDYIDVPGIVQDQANKWGVHPSIIYGHYLKDKNDKNEYKKLNKFLISPEKAIKGFVTHPWEYETIKQAAEEVKKIYTSHTIIEEN